MFYSDTFPQIIQFSLVT